MKVEPTVERILRDYPATRDSDRKLILSVWWFQDNNFDKDFKRFFQEKAVMPETITRARRKIQERGLYQASKQVEQQRYQKYVDARYTSGATVTKERQQ